MSLFFVFVIIAGMAALSLVRLPILAWFILWPLAVYAFLHLGLAVPVPASVQNIYMSLTVMALVVYVLADAKRFSDFKSQIVRFVCEPKYSAYLYGVGAALPVLLAVKIYFDMSVEVRAPSFPRTVHPPPPREMSFKDKKIDLIKGKNPYRELETKEPQKFAEHAANGKRVYYQNCVFCHGDDMRGDGIYAHALNPLPAEFGTTTIGMLQEGYLFWRIAKGGPGLPDEAGPWSSAMPAWEKFLSEDEIWDVIIYLYEHTGLKPREEEEHHE